MTKRDLLLIFLLALAALAAYSNGLTGEFLYDDRTYVTKNPQVNEDLTLAELFTQSTPPEKPHLGLYRPFFVLTLRWNHVLSGFKPSAFHGTNLLIHILATAALFLLARRLTGDRAGAFLGALLFAVHPAHVEAVTWIVGRAELLACLFCLLAALCHFEARTRPLFRIGEAICFCLAVLSKENALAFPLVLWLLEHFVRQQSDAGWIKNLFRSYGLYLVLITLLIALRYRVLGRFSPAIETAPFQDAGLPERVEAAFSSLAGYLRLFVFPYPLKIFYHISEIRDLTVVRIGLLGGFVVMIWLAWKIQKPVLGWLLWIPAALLPVLNLVPIGAVFAERFFYLPSAGACMAGGLLLTRLVRWERKSRDSHLTVWIPTAAVLAFALLTFARNPVFNTSLDLWKDAVNKGGQFAFPHYNLGECFFEEKLFEYQSPEMQGAVREFRKSLALNPDHPYAFAAYYRLGQYYLQKYTTAERPEPEHLRAAVESLEQSIASSPPVPEAIWKPILILAGIPLDPVGRKYLEPARALQYLEMVDDFDLARNQVEAVRKELRKLIQ